MKCKTFLIGMLILSIITHAQGYTRIEYGEASSLVEFLDFEKNKTYLLNLSGRDTVIGVINTTSSSTASGNVSIQYSRPLSSRIDAPWYIENSIDVIPVVMIHQSSLGNDIEGLEIKDANNDDAIVASVYFNPNYVMNAGDIFSYLFLINKSSLNVVDGRIRLKGKILISWAIDATEGPIDIEKRLVDTPKFQSWFCGDTHFHTNYTSSVSELGGRLDASIQSANAVGLDWLVITDHSFDLNDTPDEWEYLMDECNQYDGKTKCLIGEEVSCRAGSTIGKPTYNHFLAYNISEFIPGCEWEDSVCNGGIYNCSEINSVAESQGGFGFIAHPGHADRDTFGWGWGFRVRWVNYSYNYTGSEFWNSDISDSNWLADMQRGYDAWIEQLSTGRKVPIIGGSDAHGDFQGPFGKVMTCCKPESFTKENIFNALKKGNCYVSNTGALKFGVGNSRGGVAMVGGSVGEPGWDLTITVDYDVQNSCTLRVFAGYNGSERVMKDYGAVSGNGTKNFTSSLPSVGYYRVECISGDGGSRIYTNPIWVEYTVDLEGGWNLFSFPKTLNKTSPAEVFEPISEKYTHAVAYHANDSSDLWKFYFADPKYASLSDLNWLDHTHGYWIRATNDTTLTYAGAPPSTTDIRLYGGWNLVGFPKDAPQKTSTALSSIKGNYSIVWAYNASDKKDPWKCYLPQYPTLGDLQKMHPRLGYWIRLNTTQETLRIQNTQATAMYSMAAAGGEEPEANESLFQGCEITDELSRQTNETTMPQPSVKYAGYATVNGQLAGSGTRITVETQSGETVADGVLQCQGYSLEIPIGDAGNTLDHRASAGEKLVWKINNLPASTPKNDAVNPGAFEPYHTVSVRETPVKIIWATPANETITTTAGQTITFAVEAVAAGQPKYNWTLDGQTKTTTQDYAHTTQPGTHTIKATVAYGGKTDTRTWTIKTPSNLCTGSPPPLTGLWFISLPTICGNNIVEFSGEMKLNQTLTLNGTTIKLT